MKGISMKFLVLSFLVLTMSVGSYCMEGTDFITTGTGDSGTTGNYMPETKVPANK
jgi:hypothetical protein